MFSGRLRWHLNSFRHFPNGVIWDPRGKYIVTMSTDRKLDFLCASKGIPLICIQNCDLPKTDIGILPLSAGVSFFLVSWRKRIVPLKVCRVSAARYSAAVINEIKLDATFSEL